MYVMLQKSKNNYKIFAIVNIVRTFANTKTQHNG